jgi:hypothetical protein
MVVVFVARWLRSVGDGRRAAAMMCLDAHAPGDQPKP